MEMARQYLFRGHNERVADQEKTIFEILAQSVRQNVKLLLVGGHALQSHGVTRQTLDIDCLLADVDEGTLESILLGEGFTRLARTENFARFRHSKLGYLDALLVDPTTFVQMLEESQPYQIGAATLRVPSLSHLIALKLHAIKNNPARELRDMSDITDLVRQNSFSTEKLRSLCNQFGPPGIWPKLKAHI